MSRVHHAVGDGLIKQCIHEALQSPLPETTVSCWSASMNHINVSVSVDSVTFRVCV